MRRATGASGAKQLTCRVDERWRGAKAGTLWSPPGVGFDGTVEYPNRERAEGDYLLMSKAHRTLRALLAVSAVQGLLGEQSRLRGQLPDSVATVGGWVLEHETDVPLEGATVSLAGPDGLPEVATQISGPGGTFVFPAVSPGLYRLSATLLGYTQLRDTLRVEGASDLEVTLPLSVSPVPLEPMVVVVRRAPIGPLAGFDRRRRTMRGTYITREDIDASRPFEFTDLLRTVPGVRLVPTSTYGYRVFFRGGCVPDLWLDGTHIGMTEDIDTFLRPEGLEGVEIYRGPELPGEFGTNLCGAIVAWTRRGAPATGERNLKRQLIFAASFVFLVFFTTR